MGCGSQYDFNKAKKLEHDGKYKEAIQKYNDIMTKFPNSITSNMAKVSIADIRFKQKDFKNAMVYYKDLSDEGTPISIRSHSQKMIGKIEEIFQKEAKLLKAAEKDFNNGAYSDALDIFNKIEIIDPKNPELRKKKRQAKYKLNIKKRKIAFEENLKTAHDFSSIITKCGGWGWMSRILGMKLKDIQYKPFTIYAKDEFERKRKSDEIDKQVKKAYSKYKEILDNIYKLSFSFTLPEYNFKTKKYELFYDFSILEMEDSHIWFKKSKIIFPPLEVDEKRAEKLRNENKKIKGIILFKLTGHLEWVTKGKMWVPEGGIYRPAKKIVRILTQSDDWAEMPQCAYAKIIDARINIPQIGIRLMIK